MKIQLQASMVYTLINDKIINITLEVDRNAVGLNKFDETIEDVNLYLNFLTKDDIVQFIKDGPELITAEDVLNKIVSNFNTKHITVTCKVPAKFNFMLDSALEKTEPKEDDVDIFLTAFAAMLVLCIIILLLNIFIK